jgi:hypothetical protein
VAGFEAEGLITVSRTAASAMEAGRHRTAESGAEVFDLSAMKAELAGR